ncbi:MAG TPA: TPM domain-containing protein [Thermoanaerobaculia bacterium]|nr:TPM domain-containing protein [Thermoanaerobaculia bacterium]
MGRPLLLALLLLLPLRADAAEVPALQGRVNDYANLLSPGQKQNIESQLAQFEQQTGHQVAVLTIATLDGEDIADYGNRVARAWALGQTGKDDGALLLVAQQDRKMRIEVGYGLEGVLTDLQTGIIQNEVIIPYFKRGDFGGGIEAGVNAILSTIQGKAVEPAPVQSPASGGGGGGGDWLGFLIFGLFALGPFVLNAIRSGSWIVYIVLLPILFFLGSIFSVVTGLVVAGLWLVLFPILRAILPKHPPSGRFGGRRGGGGWWIGPGMGGGGGGGGGWGGGGGGFSGGGGSFGGGGSSSSW